MSNQPEPVSKVKSELTHADETALVYKALDPEVLAQIERNISGLEPVSDPEIAELMEAYEKATPEPWTWNQFDQEMTASTGVAGFETCVFCTYHEDPLSELDAKYLTKAANLAPKLVARIQVEQKTVASLAHSTSALLKRAEDAEARIRELEGVLEAVVRCECTFSLDPLEHAKNAVQHCRDLAMETLKR